MQQGEEVRNDSLYGVCHEYLVAVQLYAVLLQIQIGLDLGEIEDTGKVEGEIHVKVYPEHRLLLHGIELAVERLVVIILEVTRGLGPQVLHIIHYVVLGGLNLLSVFPLLLLAAGNLYGQETAVFLEQALDGGLLQVLLAVIIQVEDDIGTAVGLIGISKFKFG